VLLDIEMAEIPEFDDAVHDLEKLLLELQHPTSINWIFRDDLWCPRMERMLIRWPVREGATELATMVYEQGRRRGLAEVRAIAKSDEKVFATVWFPKFPEEEVQGWNRNLKVSVSSPLIEAALISKFSWSVLSLAPGFKRFQASYPFVGSRKWANAC
jgi:hypothetical protein